MKCTEDICKEQRMPGRCRVCGNAFFEAPLVSYANMPGAAQHLPDQATVKNEKGVDLEVCQCAGCGLVQLNCDPVPYYREVIRAVGFSPEMTAFRSKQFKEFAAQHSLRGKKTIEIGCGQGEYLTLIKQAGMDAQGIEYADDALKHCAAAGLKVSKGFIERGDEQLNGAPFAAFFILSFLEHWPDPNAGLKGIHRNLADGAVGLVEVPNFDMMLRHNQFAEFIGDHLFYFTQETLTALLRRNGFDLLQCSPVWHDYIISAVVRKRPRLDLRGFHDSQARLQKEVDAYIARFSLKQVAVWGAGHQAFAIMSLLGLAGKIKYVVDSAPFKQGKYTPATHIPIVSPQALGEDPVEAVLVMAGSYSDEVAKIIRQKFSGNIGVAILRSGGLEIL